MSKDVAILTVYKDGCSHRREALDVFVRYYQKHIPDAEIIMAEQDTNTPVDGLTEHVQFNTPDGYFRRGMCFNVAFTKTDRKYLVLVDSDILLDPEVLNNIPSIMEEHDIYTPYSRCADSNKGDTKELARTLEAFPNKFKVRGYTNEGGATFATRQAYLTVGGFTAGFAGYGAEDNDFLYKSRALKLRTGRNDKPGIVHMYHTGESKQSQYNSDNNNLRDGLQKLAVDKLRDVCTVAGKILQNGTDAVLHNELGVPSPDRPGTGMNHPLRFNQFLEALKDVDELAKGEWEKSSQSTRPGDWRDGLYRFQMYLLQCEPSQKEIILSYCTEADFFPVRGITYTKSMLLSPEQMASQQVEIKTTKSKSKVAPQVRPALRYEDITGTYKKDNKKVTLNKDGVVRGIPGVCFWWIISEEVYLATRDGKELHRLWYADGLLIDNQRKFILKES
jgi:hypothetical protein